MADRTDWQRRYVASIAAERATADDADESAAEVAAMETSGCLPGWLGAVMFAATTVVVLLRRRSRRPPRRHRTTHARRSAP